MLAASSAEYRTNGMLIFIPLPFEVVQRLRERKENIERHKNGEFSFFIRRIARAFHLIKVSLGSSSIYLTRV
jgi:hypothetical protein